MGRIKPKMHSEMGMPNMPTIESVQLMLPESAQWPRNLTWALHDYTLAGAQAAASFNRIIDNSYGGAAGFRRQKFRYAAADPAGHQNRHGRRTADPREHALPQAA